MKTTAGLPEGETPTQPTPDPEVEKWRKEALEIRRFGTCHAHVVASRFLRELGLRDSYPAPLPPFFLQTARQAEWPSTRLELAYTYRASVRKSPFDIWQVQPYFVHYYLVSYVDRPVASRWVFAQAIPFPATEVSDQWVRLMVENEGDGLQIQKVILERSTYNWKDEVAEHLVKWDLLPIP